MERNRREAVRGEAEATVRRALDLLPDSSFPHLMRARTMELQRRWNEAEECYRSALAAEPGSAHAHYRIGLFLAERGKSAEARGHFADAHRIEPNDWTYRVTSGGGALGRLIRFAIRLGLVRIGIARISAERTVEDDHLA